MMNWLDELRIIGYRRSLLPKVGSFLGKRAIFMVKGGHSQYFGAHNKVKNICLTKTK